jgi:hypothetical protein
MVNIAANITDSVDVCQDLSASHLMKEFLCNGAGSNTANGLSCRGATASCNSSDTIFLVIGSISVRRTVCGFHFAIILRLLVFITNQNANGSAEGGGPVGSHAGKNFTGVSLLTRGSNFTLSWPTAIKLILNLFLRELKIMRKVREIENTPLVVGECKIKFPNKDRWMEFFKSNVVIIPTCVTLSLGGTPSTTQPTPPPWLSPNVVTRKLFPKVLPVALTIKLLLRPDRPPDLLDDRPLA